MSSTLEVLVDAVIRATRDRLGDKADPQMMQMVVREVVGAMMSAQAQSGGAVASAFGDTATRPRAIVTSSGRNTHGVVAGISSTISEANGDIQDMSQTIVSDFFTLIMVVDLTELAVSFAELKARLKAEAERLGIHVVVMHEDVMRALQRV